MSHLYFDTAYVGKCYLNEPDALAVRETARSGEGLYTSALVMAELACAFHRNLREGTLTHRSARTARDQFLADVRSEVWRLLPVTDHILNRIESLTRALPHEVFPRAGDAIHIVSEVEAGFNEIWTNDHHLLAAATHFGVKARSAA